MCNILSQDIKKIYKTILVFSLITYTENIEGRWEIKHFCREKKKKFSINGLARSMLVYVGDKTSSTDLQRELHTITRTKKRLEQKIDNSSKSFQQRNNRVFQLENNLQRQQNINSNTGSFTRSRLNNNSYRDFGQNWGQNRGS